MPKLATPELSRLYRMATHNATVVPPGRKADLSLLVLNVSEGCNLACSYCFADRGQYGRSHPRWMTIDTARSALDFIELNYRSLGTIKLFGGEPLINFQLLVNLVREVKYRKYFAESVPKFVMITNGTLITPEIIDWIRDNQINVTVSYDGTSAIHDSHRVYPSGAGSAAKVIAGLQLLKPVMSQVVIEAVYGPGHMLAGLSMTHIASELKLEYGPKAVLLHPMLRSNRGSFAYSDADWQIFEESIREQARINSHDEMVASFDNDGELFRYFAQSICKAEHADAHCGLGIDTITVQADGNILPCYTLDSHSEYRMGHVGSKDMTAFDKISEVFMSNKKSSNPYCADCDIITLCHSCPGGMLDVQGSLDRPVSTVCENMIGTIEGRLLALEAVVSKWGINEVAQRSKAEA